MLLGMAAGVGTALIQHALSPDSFIAEVLGISKPFFDFPQTWP
jgi:hypothetical protein